MCVCMCACIKMRRIPSGLARVGMRRGKKIRGGRPGRGRTRGKASFSLS